MSLTAHLLFRRETKLPKGRIITHNADTRRGPITAGQLDAAARNYATRMANIERVFNAIEAAGKKVSMLDIEVETGLARTTVLNACEELENWKAGGRIIRHKGRRHTFEVAKETRDE